MTLVARCDHNKDRSKQNKLKVGLVPGTTTGVLRSNPESKEGQKGIGNLLERIVKRNHRESRSFTP
jgi:hypothetical protein